MGLRGTKPKGTVEIQWSPEFAYAIGLLVTDGSLSNDGRHITLVSKDTQQLKTFARILHLKNRIGVTRSGYNGKLTPRIQFGDVIFYKFLLSIGLMPNKTKIIGEVEVPRAYFFDFLRGHFDGDGSFHSYFDPRWKSSYMFYTIFVSASLPHLLWIRGVLRDRLKINGHITTAKGISYWQLKFAKRESLILLRSMYRGATVYLLRKKLKIKKALAIVGEHL
jgi:hypothetical protein